MCICCHLVTAAHRHAHVTMTADRSSKANNDQTGQRGLLVGTGAQRAALREVTAGAAHSIPAAARPTGRAGNEEDANVKGAELLNPHKVCQPPSQVTSRLLVRNDGVMLILEGREAAQRSKINEGKRSHCLLRSFSHPYLEAFVGRRPLQR